MQVTKTMASMICSVQRLSTSSYLFQYRGAVWHVLLLLYEFIDIATSLNIQQQILAAAMMSDRVSKIIKPHVQQQYLTVHSSNWPPTRKRQLSSKPSTMMSEVASIVNPTNGSSFAYIYYSTLPTYLPTLLEPTNAADKAINSKGLGWLRSHHSIDAGAPSMDQAGRTKLHTGRDRPSPLWCSHALWHQEQQGHHPSQLWPKSNHSMWLTSTKKGTRE